MMICDQTAAWAPPALDSCRLCQSPNGVVHSVVPHMPVCLWPTLRPPPHDAVDAALFICRDCGHLQLQQMDETVVDRLYAEGSFVQDDGAGHAARKSSVEARLGSGFFTGKRLLDIGGGNNPFVGLIESAERWVSDIVISGAARRATDRAILGRFGTADLPHGYFDIITAFHTLEHFPEPNSVVRRIATLMRPGGTVIVEVPSFSGYARQLPHYAVFHQHQSYFTAETLDAIFLRSGFELIERFRDDAVLFAAYRLTSDPRMPAGIPRMTERMANEWRARLVRLDAALSRHLETIPAIRVGIYAAGGSTTTFLALLPDLRRSIVAIFDRDPRKHGLYVPGTEIRVSPPDTVDSSSLSALLFLDSKLYQRLAPDYVTPAIDVGALIEAI